VEKKKGLSEPKEEKIPMCNNESMGKGEKVARARGRGDLLLHSKRGTGYPAEERGEEKRKIFVRRRVTPERERNRTSAEEMVHLSSNTGRKKVPKKRGKRKTIPFGERVVHLRF